MRLETQDQLTAIARFFDDVWRATSATTGNRGVEQMRATFGLYLDAPSEATWEGVRDLLAGLVGEVEAGPILADVERYVR